MTPQTFSRIPVLIDAAIMLACCGAGVAFGFGLGHAVAWVFLS